MIIGDAVGRGLFGFIEAARARVRGHAWNPGPSAGDVSAMTRRDRELARAQYAARRDAPRPARDIAIDVSRVEERRALGG